MPTELDVMNRAQIIGRIAHRGQYRWPIAEPYFNHPTRVANRMASFAPNFGGPLLIAAAYLHDVVEDCEISAHELNALVGNKRVVDLVLQVTHVSKLSDGNRALRRGIDRAHVAKSDQEGATLKCADIEDNLTSDFSDEIWARKYFAEKKLELDILGHAYGPALELAMAAWRRGPNIVPHNCAQLAYEAARKTLHLT